MVGRIKIRTEYHIFGFNHGNAVELVRASDTFPEILNTLMRDRVVADLIQRHNVEGSEMMGEFENNW